MFAKRGAEVARHLFLNDAAKQGYQAARAWYRWASFYAENWPEDADTTPLNEQKVDDKQEAVKSAMLHPEAPHKLWRTACSWVCATCGRKARSKGG